jgi:tetratricopeptide (TPR) repeat protein
LKLLDSSSLPKIKICYVMTEIVSGNIEFWKQHPCLKTYFDLGVLDSAFYHDSQNEFIHLMHRNETLSKETLVNPLILICNYFFDSIPQDLFRFNNGQLEEGLITLSVTEDESTSHLNPLIINKLMYHYSYQPILSSRSNYYEIPEFNTFLKSYSQTFEGVPFLFPVGAFRVLRTFIEWSQFRLLLLAGDKGVCTEEQIRQSGDPKLALHGSFSFPVNFHSIIAFFRTQIDLCSDIGDGRGTTLLTSFPDTMFTIMAGVLGNKDAHFPETILAFQEHIDRFEPIDYFKFVSLTEEKWKEPPLDHILLLIKLGNWDANVVLSFFPAIRQAIVSATEKQKQLLCATIDKVYEHFYPIGPSTGDFVLDLGVLLFEMQYFEKSKNFFYSSMQISGVNATALKNIAACYQMLGNFQKAKEYKLKAVWMSLNKNVPKFPIG